MTAQSRSRQLSDFLPALKWLSRYDRAWLPIDLIAGLSVWALLVPQGIAYSSIAGVPPQYGLYAALAALIGYAIFGTSKQLVTGPSATVAAVSFTVISLLGLAPNSFGLGGTDVAKFQLVRWYRGAEASLAAAEAKEAATPSATVLEASLPEADLPAADLPEADLPGEQAEE